MMKWFMYLVLIVAVGASWFMFMKSGKELKTLDQQISNLENIGDPDGKVPDLKTQYGTKEGEKTIEGILLTFLSAGVVGIFLVVYLLPFFAQRVTHAVYDSAEMVEKDVMHDARSMLAQGDYEGAIAAFQQAAAADSEAAHRRPPHPVQRKATKEVLDPVERRRQQGRLQPAKNADQQRNRHERRQVQVEGRAHPARVRRLLRPARAGARG